MSIQVADIKWVAETFQKEDLLLSIIAGKPTLRITTIDESTARKAYKLLVASGTIYNIKSHRDNKFNKPVHRVVLTGDKAIEWMFTLYSLLSEKYRFQIGYIVKYWMKK